MTQTLVPIVLDFETFYDAKEKYSLKDMPTAQYVRDQRFAVLGAGVRLPGSPAVWLEPDRLSEFLAAVPWDQTLLVCHNAAFDGLVLTETYGYRPARYACTMSMLRFLIAQGVLNARMTTSLEAAAPLVGMEKGDMEAALKDGTLGEYAAMDAEICGTLFDRYWHQLPEEEQEYIDIHVRMAAEPVLDLDLPLLESVAAEDAALEELFPLVRKDNLFAAALEGEGVALQYKTTAKGNLKPATAKTDAFMQELLSHDNEMVRMLAELRLKARSTINRSRSQRFLDVGSPLPAPILYYAAHTGRGGGQDKLNVQNLPRTGNLRRTVRAPEGYTLVIVDSAQVEVRVNAWLAGQEDLLDDFRLGRDPYVAFAAYRYGEDYDDLLARYKAGDPDAALWRQICKAAVLALGFMQGDEGFLSYCERNRVPIDGRREAREVVAAYRKKHNKIVASADAALDEIRRDGAQVAPNGTRLTYPDLRLGPNGDLEWRRPVIFAKSANEGWGPLWRGAAIENKVQKVARDVVFWQTLLLHKCGYRVVLMAHDETVLLVRQGEAEVAKGMAEHVFSVAPPWAEGLPLAGEVRMSQTYAKG